MPSPKEHLYSTGIVRRIDEIGRVVIPKEMRITMGWLPGDPVELYCDRQGNVILHKYSQLDGISGFGDLCIQQLHKQLGVNVMLCDLEQVIAVAGLPVSQLDKTPPRWLQGVLNNIRIYREDGRIGVPLVTQEGTALIGALGITSKYGIDDSKEAAVGLVAKIITEYATAS
jgi:AbrB family looped-hinge helix DNA binding protein